MHNREPIEAIRAFDRALDKLEQVLHRSPQEDDIVLDATIQRFEFSIELCWKALKRSLFHEGIDTTTPKSVLQQAYVASWIHDEQLWLNMLKDRNLTSHTYHEKQAQQIYDKIPNYATAMRQLCNFLKEKYSLLS